MVQPLSLRFEQDAIGNMFLRRKGSDDTAPAVAFGSHLDTVPTGGRFDGVFGVLAGLEVIRALDAAGIVTRAPLELVNWTNEEGSRFRPAMMGSRVHAADMTLEDALAITDDNGISVRDALRDSGQAGALTPSPRGWACWLEAHIEQGPSWRRPAPISASSPAPCTRAISNLPSLASPAMSARPRWTAADDSLAATAEIILAVERIALAAEPGAAPRRPGSRTIPTRAATSPTSPACIATCVTSGAERAVAMEARTAHQAGCHLGRAGACRVAVDPYATFGPIAFDRALGDSAARQGAGASARHARHDRGRRPRLCAGRTALPQRDAVRAQRRRHHPQSAGILDQGTGGAVQVLLDAVLALAS